MTEMDQPITAFTSQVLGVLLPDVISHDELSKCSATWAPHYEHMGACANHISLAYCLGGRNAHMHGEHEVTRAEARAQMRSECSVGILGQQRPSRGIP